MEKNDIKCPKCGSETRQRKKGFTHAGSQRMLCCDCGYKYTPNPKQWGYSEETRKRALQLLALGNTGRGIGKIMNMSQSNAYRWAKEEAAEEAKKAPHGADPIEID